MNKHFSIALLSLVLVCGMTSCLKDDINSTIIYSSQVIPDINTFMPHRLLMLMQDDTISSTINQDGSMNYNIKKYIHFGDEPPRFSGHYNNIGDLICKALDDDNGNIRHQFSIGSMMGNHYTIDFYDQVKGILSISNSNDFIQGILLKQEVSEPKASYAYFDESIEPLLACPDCPEAFRNGKYTKKDLKNGYIMGNGSEFTIYFYDVIVSKYPENSPITTHTSPCMTANIISGTRIKDSYTLKPHSGDTTKADTIWRYRIENFLWGREKMGYYGDVAVNDSGLAYLTDNSNNPISPSDEQEPNQ